MDDEPVGIRPLYREITDETRASGDGQALSRVKTEMDRLYDQFAARYPRGRGASVVIHVEVRRPGQ